MPDTASRSWAAVGSSGRPASARAASANQAYSSAGLYSSTRSEALSMTSVSERHSPVSASWTRLRERNVQVGRDGEVVRVLVEQHHAAELVDAVLVALAGIGAAGRRRR